MIKCTLCPHRCSIEDGQSGFCGVRVNRNDMIVSTNHLRFSAIALDPVEKKPFYHFHPGKMILSLGSTGCNLACSFCQNSEISKEFGNVGNVRTFNLSVDEIIEQAMLLKDEGNIGIAFTYNEPVVWYDTVMEIAKECKNSGLETAMVTNGYIEQEPLKELIPFIDAWNIDLKAFSDEFYRTIVRGSLKPVLDTIRTTAPESHVEITTLVIPGLNDADEEMDKEASFIASVDENIPLHISRFFPRYHLQNIPPTPVSTLDRLRRTASRHLKNVYIGNV